MSFDIKKLTVLSGQADGKPKVMYDRESETLSGTENITPYINFKPMDIRAENGLANYSFSTKNEDIDAVFDAHILTKDRYGKIIVDKKAEPITISARSTRISVQSKVKSGEKPFEFNSVVEAGNSNGIYFGLKKIDKNEVVLSDSLPYTLRVYDDIDDKLVSSPINVTKNEYLFRDTSILNKSGVYRFEFIDQKGIKGFSTVTVLPAIPVKIEVTPSSNIFIAGQKTTVLVRILDSFGNVAQ